jgi:hypothetical protein
MTDTTSGAGTRADDGTIDLRDGQEAREDPRQHPGQDPLDTATPLDPSTPADRFDPDAGHDQTLSTSDLVDRGRRPDEAESTHRSDTDRSDTDRSEAEEKPTPLISDGDAYLERWQGVQAGFVDDPRTAVQQADSLVAEVIQRIAESFADERDQLEKQWSGGENVGTEELRVQLQRYRSFFTRLLHT